MYIIDEPEAIRKNGVSILAEEKDKLYVSDNAQLMSEWDWENNSKLGLESEKLTYGSSKKAWWKCQKGHSWQTSVSKRSSGQNCPFCSGKKAWKGYNDLSTTNPEIISEWDFDKNEITPYECRPMSNKKVWWICNQGHSWNAVIAKRVSGEKCPVCQGKQILSGFNDLATTHRSLVMEWDYEKNIGITPEDISKGSEEKVWWKCKRNHNWKAAVYSRVSGVGCPHCAKEIQSSFPEKAIYFYIKRIFPDAIANYRSDELRSFELDIFIPSLRIGIEYDGERWHRNAEKDLHKNQLCDEMNIVLFRVREPLCPALLDNRSICVVRESKRTGLDKTINNLLAEINKTVNIECSIDIDLEKDGASILELLNSTEKENNIQFMNLKIVNEWDYKKNGTLLPDMVTPGSDKKVWWICNQGHSYQSSISSRTRGRGCPICSGKKVLQGYNDFESNFTELAQEWDYEKNSISPHMVTLRSDKKVWWICNQGHSYQVSISSRTRGNGCPICSGKKVLQGCNDFESNFIELVQEWDYKKNSILPNMVSYGSDKKVWWICDKGHSYKCSINNRRNGQACYFCSGKRVLAGFNDISTTHPDVAEQCFV